MNLNCSNLLITGGAGFIGSNFINYIVKKYKNVNIVNLDKLTYAGSLKNLQINNHKNYNFIEGDICDYELVKNIFLNYKIDSVINFAAESHVDNSITGPEIFIKTNINGTFNLLKVAYECWMISPFKTRPNFNNARFHQISTDEVYGSIDRGSFKESSPYKPNSPYSSSKASADMLVRSFHKTYGLNTTISISSNNYGTNQNKEKFIPKTINSIINEKPVEIYGDGKNIRDWIFVYDHCQAIELIFKNAKSGEKYNIGGGFEISNIDLVKLLHQKINSFIKKKLFIKFINDRFGHDFRYSIDNNKIYNNLGWKPSYKFENEISIYLKKIIRN